MLLDKLELKTKALSFVSQATDKASSVDDYLTSSIISRVSTRISIWLAQHPLISWLVSHPLIALVASLIIAILIVRLVLTIYRAIANIIDRMWLAILRSPFALLKFLFGWQPKPDIVPPTTTVTNYEVTNNPEKLQEIVSRLDLIQQQQQEIMQELALLKQQPLTIDSQQLGLTKSKSAGNQISKQS